MIPIQSRITIKLENKLEKAYPSVGGDYIQQSTKKDGKDHWIQEGGSYALWYSSTRTYWYIGDKTKIGADYTNGALLAWSGSEGPLEGHKYYYLHDNVWKDGLGLINLSINAGLNNFNFKKFNQDFNFMH